MENFETVCRVVSYKQDIEKLEAMIKTYNSVNNLFGGFHADMLSEINSQITHCKNCIDALIPEQKMEIKVILTTSLSIATAAR